MGSCCDGTNDSDSQIDRNPKQSRPQNQIRYVKYTDPAQAKVPAHDRQSSSVRKPNYAKEIKGSPSQKSSNSETISSNKSNPPLERPSPLTNAPAMLSNNQPISGPQPQKQYLPPTSSLPKHEKPANPQVNAKAPIQQNQIPTYQGPKNYGQFLPPRQSPQPTTSIVRRPPLDIAPQKIIISQSDRPKEVNWPPKQPIKIPTQQPLNQKFQNTVKDSQMSQSVRYSITELQNLSHHGLPNVGNTCYINSILQMIFAAEELIKEISRIAKRKRFILHQLIANVYEDITNKSSYDKKRHNLIKVLRHIEKKDPEFSQYKQNDAVQCFLCVMNLLDEEHSSDSKLDSYFKIEYEPRCRCTKDGSFIVQDHFVKSQQFCVRCKQNISFYIHSTGPYIIIFSNSQTKDLRKQIRLETKDNKLRYENKAFVTYYGNKRSGHYIAHKKIESGWIEISDSSVQFIGSSSNIHNYAPMITLYSLKK